VKAQVEVLFVHDDRDDTHVRPDTDGREYTSRARPTSCVLVIPEHGQVTEGIGGLPRWR
jgi:hypothetical protein